VFVDSKGSHVSAKAGGSSASVNDRCRQELIQEAWHALSKTCNSFLVVGPLVAVFLHFFKLPSFAQNLSQVF
jgi:hypothetical protein